MPHSLSEIILHVVFSTKGRRPAVIRPLQGELQAYMTGILENLGCPALAVGVVEDHGHSGFIMCRDKAVSEVVREVKRSSTLWLREKGLVDFAWQSGYGVFSVGSSGRNALVRYIRCQRQRHRKISFETEYVELLKIYGVEYDEGHPWG